MASLGQEFLETYKKYVTNNPDTASNIESILRVFSYVYPGSNPAISELLYAAGNLLTLLNDALLRQAKNIAIRVPICNKKLATWLSVLEHVEVFLEIAGESHGSEPTRWFIIICIQIAKAAIRFVMLYKYKSGVQISPYIPVLNRKKELNDQEKATASSAPASTSQDSTFTLSRSGRVVRKLDSTPPLMTRDWKLPLQSNEINETEDQSLALTDIQFLGECLHIFRPLIHLLCLSRFGVKSWKPWLVAGQVDAASLWCLYRGGPSRCAAEQAEMRRRTIMMTLYLLRSPFYERCSRERVMKMLKVIRSVVPLSRLIVNPLLDYLPYWQRIYFYNWMS